MTLRLAQDGRVMAAGLREAFPNGPKLTLVSLSRENGMFLRSVSFLRRSHPRGTWEPGTRTPCPMIGNSAMT